MIKLKVPLTKITEMNNDAAQRILKQARLTALEVIRTEAIVDHALGAAAVAMEAIERSDSAQLAAAAKETLHVARRAAADVLNVAKAEANETLRIAAVLAEKMLISEQALNALDASNDAA